MVAKPGHRFTGDLRLGAGNAPRRASARFDVRGLVIEADDQTGERIWPYPTLTTAGTAAGASPGADGMIAVASAREPGAELLVRDPLFISALRQAAPQITGRAPRGPSWIPLVLSSIGYVAVLAGIIYAVIAFLPYKTFARWIPDSTRETVGKLTVQQITQGRKTCEAPSGRAALDNLVRRLTDAAKTPAKFNVKVYDWGLVNAFAAMGNQLVLTKGLIDAATSPDEVAGVLAHEMGHSIEMHPEAGVLRAVGSVVIIQAMLGGWSPDVLTSGGAQVILLGYSRAAETEADDVALRMLKEAKIPAKGFANFFERLHAKEKKDGAARVPDILSTHPPSPERAKRALAAGDYASTAALSPAEWAALRTICSN